MRLKKIFIISFSLLLFSCEEKSQQQPIPAPSLLTEEQQFTAFLDSLKQAGNDDYQIVNEIRRYLARKLDYGQSRDSIYETYYKMPWQDFSGFHCIKLFEENKLTSKCGLSSYVLAKLYDYAGYKNYIYDCGYKLYSRNFGNSGNNAEDEYILPLSHEFNLVELNGRLYVQDAFLNMTIADSDGLPKEFINMLAEIKQGNFSDITVAQDTVISEFWADSLKSVLPMYCMSSSYHAYFSDIAIVDNRVKINVNRSYEFLAAWTLEQLRTNFKADGLSENFLSIYLKPKNLKDGNTGEKADSLFSVVMSVTNSDSQD